MKILWNETKKFKRGYSLKKLIGLKKVKQQDIYNTLSLYFKVKTFDNLSSSNIANFIIYDYADIRERGVVLNPFNKEITLDIHMGYSLKGIQEELDKFLVKNDIIITEEYA